MADSALPDVTATFHALRERGAQRIDPIRFSLIESLTRRAAEHGGATRQLLDDKVAALIQSVNEAVTLAEARSSDDAAAADKQGLPARGELAKLVVHIAQQKPQGANAMAVAGTSASPTAPTKATPDSPVDPKTLQFFRRTWSRLSADQRLAQSRSSLPDNAGPLNSQHLVHRSLNVMRELSPEYFDLFISHVDTLLWLERANEQAAKEVGLPPRAKGGRKAAGAKRG